MKKRTSIITVLSALTLAVSLTACGGASGETAKFDAGKNVQILAREDGSGTKTAFMEIIGLKGKADPTNVIIQTGTAGILADVKTNVNAIAYESLGFVTSDIKAIKVDGSEATVDNIKNGSYKISRPLSVVYKADTLNDTVNKAFYDFLQSAEAQALISEAGYVSMVDGATAYAVNDALTGTIDISGSTSLQPLMTEKLAPAFKALQPNVTVNVSGGGSGTGYQNAEEGVSAFGMISEEFNSEKAPSCTDYVVCKDGIAVIVNKANTIDNISMDDLKNLYDEEAASDSVKWSDIIK